MSLFGCWYFKNVFTKNTNEQMPVFLLLKDHKIDPSINFLLYKADSVNIKQENHLHSLLVRCKLLVVPKILHDNKFRVISLVSMNKLSACWRLKILLNLFLLEKVLLLHELLTPASECYPVVSLVLLENLF